MENSKVHFNDPYKRSRAKDPIDQNAVVLTGSSVSDNLRLRIREYLGLKNDQELRVYNFADGETILQIEDNVAKKDVYIVQSTCNPVNDNLMELAFMISACKRAAAKSVHCIIPYFGYARQDRKFLNRQVPHSAADVCAILRTMGCDHIISIDLHAAQITGMAGSQFQFEDYEASVVALRHFLSSIEDKTKLTIVAPDAGAVKRASVFQKQFNKHGHDQVDLVMISKERKVANQVEKMTIYGDVQDRICIILDDMIDTAGTLCKAGDLCKEKGASQVFAFATHGLFNGPAADRILDSKIEKVFVTDSIPLKEEVKQKVEDKIEQLSLDLMIAELIRRTHLGEKKEELLTTPYY